MSNFFFPNPGSSVPGKSTKALKPTLVPSGCPIPRRPEIPTPHLGALDRHRTMNVKVIYPIWGYFEIINSLSALGERLISLDMSVTGANHRLQHHDPGHNRIALRPQLSATRIEIFCHAKSLGKNEHWMSRVGFGCVKIIFGCLGRKIDSQSIPLAHKRLSKAAIWLLLLRTSDCFQRFYTARGPFPFRPCLLNVGCGRWSRRSLVES